MWGYPGNGAPFSYAPLPSSLTHVDYTGVTVGNNTDQFVTPQAVPGFANTKLISIERQAGAIKTDGSGWVWGPTDPAGNRPAAFGGVPIQVIPSGAYHVSAGLAHVSFVKTDGTVWSVGMNTNGCFGNGTVDPSQSFTTAQQMTITNAVRVATTGDFTVSRPATVVLKRDGTVWIAGNKSPLTANTTNLPVQVPGLTNAVDIKVGDGFAVALTAAGDCYTWGDRYEGYLGIGEVGSQQTGVYTTPQKVIFPAGTPPIVAIETEGESGVTYAIDETGTLWTWGAGRDTYMFGVVDDRNAPIPIVSARHVADITVNGPTIAYMTRNADYPTDQRIWFIGATGANALKIFALNPKEAQNTSVTPLNYASTLVGRMIWAVSRPEDTGLTGVGVITPTTSISGTTDCAATAIVGSLVVGTPSNVILKVTATVSTTGTGSFSVSGSGLTASSPASFNTTTTGQQIVYLPMAYDGTALGATTFTFSGLGACTADLSGLTLRPVLTPITPLVNCTPFTSVTISK